MKLKNIFLLILAIFLTSNIFAQQLEKHEFERGEYRFMFYNVENLFDIFDDTTKIDEEFTPEGSRHWNNSKYYKKLNNIAKVVTAVGQWEAPEIIGVCEIENLSVLQDLTKKTFLKKANYKIIHRESPDNRGIDVGLLYRKDKFKPISYEAVRVTFPFENNKPTRDILYVKGRTNNKDTFHIFINHWPSRYGGQMISEKKRIRAAEVLRAKVDSIYAADKNPAIVIMGDLNDYPDNTSVVETLNAKTEYENILPSELYNIAYYMQFKKGLGSHKYHGEWGVLDQIIISGTLLDNSLEVSTSIDDAHVFDAPFLLVPDDRNTGYQPFRTYAGFKFLDGYSDHLPVYIDFKKTKTKNAK